MNKGLRDTPKSRVSTSESRDEHTRIFGERAMKTGRTKYVQIDGKLVEIDIDAPPQKPKSAFVFGDITEHRSTVTGEMVTTRSRHRQILRENGLVEVGNENLAKHTPKRDTCSKGVKEDLQRTLAELKG